MFRFVVVLALCLGLTAALASKKKSTKRLVARQAIACDVNEYQCKNGHCVQEEWTCDSDNDCGDNSDETLPECPPAGQCTGPHEIKCDNNRCAPLEFRCDGDDDCGDGTDERNCAEFECYTGEWKCGNSHCVEKDWLCDNDNDCVDGTDESPENCPSTTVATVAS